MQFTNLFIYLDNILIMSKKLIIWVYKFGPQSFFCESDRSVVT
jgi:hypothetical protein